MKLDKLNRYVNIHSRLPEIGDAYGIQDSREDLIKLIVLYVGVDEIKYVYMGRIEKCFREYFEAVVETSGLIAIGRYKSCD
jgi:hypothetical protein